MRLIKGETQAPSTGHSRLSRRTGKLCARNTQEEPISPAEPRAPTLEQLEQNSPGFLLSNGARALRNTMYIVPNVHFYNDQNRACGRRKTHILRFR